jgi:hypothetical protein
MACATLKRSLDWDPYAAAGTSPMPNQQRPAKRQRFANRTSQGFGNNLASATLPKVASPFGDVQPKLSAEGIAATIKEEMMRLQNRKQLHYGTSSSLATSSNLSQSLSLNMPAGSSGLNSECSSTASFLGPSSPSKRNCNGDQPLFTFKQVGLICERLLKERESQIREEYDGVLGSKLAEQYDTFVKFTYDQIQKRFDASATPSYLS